MTGSIDSKRVNELLASFFTRSKARAEAMHPDYLTMWSIWKPRQRAGSVSDSGRFLKRWAFHGEPVGSLSRSSAVNRQGVEDEAMDIIDFLEARISEDEAVAQAASPAPWEWFTETGRPAPALYGGDKQTVLDACPDRGPWHLSSKAEDRAYIAQFNPGRILAECAAKRKMLANVPLVLSDMAREVGGTSDYVLMCIASPYRDHPDYQEGWSIEL